MVERKTLNLVVVGSSPTVGALFCLPSARAVPKRSPGLDVGAHPSRLAQLVERKTLNLVVVGSSPTVGGLFVYFDGARNERHDPVSTTARGARLHAREVQGGRLKICWAKVRLGSNPSAGKTFLARVAFWRAVVLNNQSNNVDKHAALRGLS